MPRLYRGTVAMLLALAVLAAGVTDGALPGRGAADGAAWASPSPTPDRVTWLGGQWFALGYNFPWYKYNYDFGDDRSANVVGSLNVLDGQFADLRTYGTRVTRWYIFNDATRYPAFDLQGRVVPLPATFFENFDAMLELAAKHQVYLIPVLFDSVIAKRGRDGRAPQSTIVTDPAVRQSYLDGVLRPLLQRYGRHPHILAWSVMNEPDWPAGFTNDRAYVRIPPSSLREFVQHHAQYVHQYTIQAVTLDVGGFPWLDRWRDLGLDLYLVHWYPWIDRSYGAQFSPYNRTADTANVDKPVVIAEFPLQSTPYSVQHSLDTFYANGYAGALAWCYPNNVDEYCDYNAYSNSRETIRAWAQAHDADVNIRPAPAAP